MAVDWWLWFGAPGCQVEWFGEDGVVYTDATNTREQIDANGDVVVNGLARAMEQVRFYNLNTYDWRVHCHDNLGTRPDQDYVLTHGTPAWATFPVQPPNQLDPAHVSSSFYQ